MKPIQKNIAANLLFERAEKIKPFFWLKFVNQKAYNRRADLSRKMKMRGKILKVEAMVEMLQLAHSFSSSMKKLADSFANQPKFKSGGFHSESEHIISRVSKN